MPRKEVRALTAQDFWNGLSVGRLAEQQAVYSIEHLEALFGDFWPTEESADEVIKEIYSRRRDRA